MTQPPLFSTTDADLAARYAPQMLELLRHGRWMYRREIVQAIPALNERAVREISHRHRHLILSSEKGYRLLRTASVEEVHEAISRLLAMSKALVKDAEAYQKAINRRTNRSAA